MNPKSNTPTENEKQQNSDKRPWQKPQIIEEDYSSTEAQVPPALPGDPEQSGS